MSDHILYLSGSDLDKVDLAPSVIRGVIRDAFRSYSSSDIKVPPKQTLRITSDHYFQAMAAVSTQPSFAAVKWVGLNGANSQRGLANVNGLVILSEFETGRPLAVLDGNRLTIIRTAAMSALAAEYLAPPKATSLGFIGSGAQASGHVAALHDVLPELANVICYDRRAESAENLARHATAQGLGGRTSERIDEVLACDVVISTVPSVKGMQPFLNAHKLRPGALAIAVDMGRSWFPDSLASFDYYATDDRAQAEDPENQSKLGYPGPFDADLSELASGSVKGRHSSTDRTLFLYPGFALADLAVASELYLRAVQANIGVQLGR
ncbi:ornithine cyclodeaminase family protein [Sinorhizobium americanum]|uniref:ornithine cyclodeaminase family protein n=1 Tax=Sinorhizobium americanum TaxID=194963 RepID=UPI000560D28F|nr:ornithine cyclodeaminase family protein [Sinorhizobium americanum]